MKKERLLLKICLPRQRQRLRRKRDFQWEPSLLLIAYLVLLTGHYLLQQKAGAIAAFDLASCPVGWSTYSLAKGRILIGEGSGNTDAEGLNLTTRSLGATGGREYTTGIPAVNDLSEDYVHTMTSYLARVGSGLYTNSAADTTIGGAKADSNMPPFYALLYCQKN